MIPKKIHYCWFGGSPLPDLAIKCIDSWKKYCPDYEIIQWDESNFNLDVCEYVHEAARAKKWAFVSDYVRFCVLNEYGGLYFDTDVELINSIDDIVESGAFMACEQSHNHTATVATGLGMGIEKNHIICRMIIDSYNNDSFVLDKPITVVERVTSILEQYGYEEKNTIQEICGIKIYPWDYFCPLNFFTGEVNMTENTKSIHHYSMSWQDSFRIFLKTYQKKCKRYMGKYIGQIIYLVTSFPIKCFHKIYKIIKQIIIAIREKINEKS